MNYPKPQNSILKPQTSEETTTTQIKEDKKDTFCSGVTHHEAVLSEVSSSLSLSFTL